MSLIRDHSQSTVSAYYPTVWSQLFHSAPHLNITLHQIDNIIGDEIKNEIGDNSIYPSYGLYDIWSPTYLESVGILASTPALWLVFTLLLLLIYLCTRCCATASSVHNDLQYIETLNDPLLSSKSDHDTLLKVTSVKNKKRKSRPLRCCLSFFALITCTSLSMAFLGNHVVHESMNTVFMSSNSISTHVDRIGKMCLRFQDLIAGRVEGNLRMLSDGPFKREIREDRTAYFTLMDNVELVFHNVSGALHTMDELKKILFLNAQPNIAGVSYLKSGQLTSSNPLLQTSNSNNENNIGQYYSSSISRRRREASSIVGNTWTNPSNHDSSSESSSKNAKMGPHSQTVHNVPIYVKAIEKYRWPATIVIHGTFAFFCLLLFIGSIIHSRPLLIVFSLCALVSIVAFFLLASLYAFGVIFLSDFCTSPTFYVHQVLDNKEYSNDIVTFYTQCRMQSSHLPAAVVQASASSQLTDMSAFRSKSDSMTESHELIDFHRPGQMRHRRDNEMMMVSEPLIGRSGMNPLDSFISKMSRSVSDIERRLALISDTARRYYSNGELQPYLGSVEEALLEQRHLIDDITMALDCPHIFRSYHTSLIAICDSGLFGLILMLFSCLTSGILFTLLLWCNSHAWIYFKHKFVSPHLSSSNFAPSKEYPQVKHYMKVDDQDPYMPLSTIMTPSATINNPPPSATTLLNTTSQSLGFQSASQGPPGGGMVANGALMRSGTLGRNKIGMNGGVHGQNVGASNYYGTSMRSRPLPSTTVGASSTNNSGHLLTSDPLNGSGRHVGGATTMSRLPSTRGTAGNSSLYSSSGVNNTSSSTLMRTSSGVSRNSPMNDSSNQDQNIYWKTRLGGVGGQHVTDSRKQSPNGNSQQQQLYGQNSSTLLSGVKTNTSLYGQYRGGRPAGEGLYGKGGGTSNGQHYSTSTLQPCGNSALSSAMNNRSRVLTSTGTLGGPHHHGAPNPVNRSMMSNKGNPNYYATSSRSSYANNPTLGGGGQNSHQPFTSYHNNGSSNYTPSAVSYATTARKAPADLNRSTGGVVNSQQYDTYGMRNMGGGGVNRSGGVGHGGLNNTTSYATMTRPNIKSGGPSSNGYY